MRQILKGFVGVPVTLLVVVLLAAGGLFAYLAARDARANELALSAVCANSPIAELATRRIVWKVVHVGSSFSTDTVRDTVYTVKAGYDLTQADPPIVDRATKTVTLVLPPPKIIAVDHFLQRASTERKTLVERVFGKSGDDGSADREDIVQLVADCDRYKLLSVADLRESVASYLGGRLRDASGYDLVLQAGLDVPAKVLFNAYFEEKGVSFRLP